MKKVVCLLIAISICVFSGCSVNRENKNSIESAQYYRIFDGEMPAEVTYKIYDSNGKTVLSETTDSALSITMLDENTVDINKSIGTGLAVHKYYSVTENEFSQEFSYVICSSKNMIAYINVPKENSLQDRTIVVQNIFDEEEYFKEFELNLSPVDTPVIEGNFNEYMSEINITYLCGESQEEVSQSLNLKQQVIINN